jgi:exodeoxyribonuclease III
MFRVVTFNVNGIRAAATKGLADWMQHNGADVFCLQETKIDASLASQFADFLPGYIFHGAYAEKKGYSGVALFVKKTLENAAIAKGAGHTAYDSEGRFIRLDLPSLSILNVYIPSGTSGEDRQGIKEEFMQFFLPYTQQQVVSRKNLIVVGDFNIAHTEIDVHNPKSASKLTGFLPHERAWLSEYIAAGMADSLRLVNPDAAQYTWWSYRAAARAKNLGWRLDYQFVSAGIQPSVKNQILHTNVFMSDHIPVEVVYDLDQCK